MTILAQAATDPALPEPISFVLLWAGAILVALAVRDRFQAIWTNGPGRRRDTTKKLKRVVAGVQLAFVESLFGPAQRVATPSSLSGLTATIAHTWISPFHALRVWVDENGEVRCWLVMSRSRGYRPAWVIGSLEIRLQHTRLADVGRGFEQRNAMRGANWFGYMEGAGGGRLTWYQDVYVGVSERALLRHSGDLLSAIPPSVEGADMAEARRATVVDTLVVATASHVEPLSLVLLAADLQREQPSSFRLEQLRRRWRRSRHDRELDRRGSRT